MAGKQAKVQKNAFLAGVVTDKIDSPRHKSWAIWAK